MRSHLNAESGTFTLMPKARAHNPEQRRRALRAVMKEHNLTTNGWAVAAGVSEGTIRNFLNGGEHGSDSLSDRTYTLLASAIGVTVAELQGERPPTPRLRGRPSEEPETPIQHYVGAGDEVHLIDGDDAIDYTPSPPGFERDHGAAVIVRGESMRPVYDPGDMLFFRQRRDPPTLTKDLPARPVIVQIKDGPLYVKKLLPGSKKGRFHLLSINPLTPPLQDQPVESFAFIEWVKPRAM
jgi:hypothetical protein